MTKRSWKHKAGMTVLQAKKTMGDLRAYKIKGTLKKVGERYWIDVPASVAKSSFFREHILPSLHAKWLSGAAEAKAIRDMAKVI